MKTLSLFLVSSLAVIATPASAGTLKDVETVNFAYGAHELTTNQGRQAMLERMKATTVAACSGALAKAYRSEKACQTDLEKQFVSAIGNYALTTQYQGEAIEVARNGS